MNDSDIADTYVRFYLKGSESDSWAPIELSQLAINEPMRAWRIVEIINAIHIEDEAWRTHVRSTLGCGAIEDLIVLHESTMLPIILHAAEKNPVLRMELSAIYEGSVSSNSWVCIRAVLVHQDAQVDAAHTPRH